MAPFAGQAGLGGTTRTLYQLHRRSPSSSHLGPPTLSSLALATLQFRGRVRAVSVPPGAARTLAYLFDYSSFARTVPAHHEHALLSRVFPSGGPEPVSPAGLQPGPSAVLAQLAAAHSTPWLMLSSLHMMEVSAAANAFAAGNVGGRDAYAAHEAAAFHPAPELRSIARHVVGMLHGNLAAAPRDSARRPGPPRRTPLSGRQRGAPTHRRLTGSFDCLHVRQQQWSNATLLQQAAASLLYGPGRSRRRRPVLLVGEDGVDDDSLSSPEAHRTPSLTRMPMTVLSVLPGALRLADFYPHWDLVEVSDASGARTLAYDVVQQLVCSQAERVVGQVSSPFVEAVCHWRAAGALGDVRSTTKLQTGPAHGSRAAGSSILPGDACGAL